MENGHFGNMPSALCKAKSASWKKYVYDPNVSELTKSIVYGIGIGFLSCIGIGIGIVNTPFQVLVLVLVLLRRQPKYWYWYC